MPASSPIDRADPRDARGPRLRGDADKVALDNSVPRINLSELPADLSAFQSWWLSEPSLDAGQVTRRVPPRGSAGAELMIVVPGPEEEDCEQLLSGVHGRLVAGLLSALRIAEDRAYLASALPRHTPLPDWDDLARQGLGAVLRHHVELVRPRRLLVFGSNVLSLLGHDPAKRPAALEAINPGSPAFPLLVELDLAALLARPRAKAGLWNRLLEWTQAE